MTRLIDADVMLEELKDKEVVIAQQNIADLIDEQPTVEAEPVRHGKWINEPPYKAMDGTYKKGQECSNCHAYFVSDGNTPYSNHPYCCECGAKMDGRLIMAEQCENCKYYEPLTSYSGVCVFEYPDYCEVQWCGECLEWVARGD